MSFEVVVTICIAAVSGLAAVVIFSIRTSVSVSVALKGNTDAIVNLREYMELQDKKNDEQDKKLDEHDKKLAAHGEDISALKQTHRVRGCDREDDR